MAYDIVREESIRIDNLINSEIMLFSETEYEMLKANPWSWFLITEEQNDVKGEKESDFFLDVGYHTFANIVTLDNTLINNRPKKKSDKIRLEDMKLSKKISEINSAGRILGIPDAEIAEPMETVFNLKVKGYEILRECMKRLHDRTKDIDFSHKERDSIFYLHLKGYIDEVKPVVSFLKGSYIPYIHRGEGYRIPKDIDLTLVVNNLNTKSYISLISKESYVGGILIKPNIVPLDSIRCYTFFDLDIDSNSVVPNGRISSAARRGDKEMVLIMGRTYLMATREYAAKSDDEIEEIRDDKTAFAKLASRIRYADIFYGRLGQYGLRNGMLHPTFTKDSFNRELSAKQIRGMIAQSSLELSNMVYNLSKD